jgi:iron complex outermembrane recepter protein
MGDVTMVLFRSLAVLLIFTAQTSFAQDSDVVDPNKAEISIEQEQKKQNSNSTKGVEKLEVTGSYIRRVDVEGPTPVVTWDKQDFEVAGVDTVSDYLRESPLFGGSTDSGDRNGYFSFRGQHAGSTLVLINGMRLPKLGGPERGFYTGVESIPTNIIERVEILKDGSSALYGSDAMAGVMNFITKKDYDGAEYSTRVNVPEINKGIQQNHSLSFGKNYSRGNWFLSTQFVEQRGYTDLDAKNYYREPTVPLSSQGKINFLDSDGNFVSKLDTRLPCPPNTPDDKCSVDTRGASYIREPKQNIGTLLSSRFDLTSSTNISFVGIYNRQQRKDMGLPTKIDINQLNGKALLNVSQFGSNSLKQQAGTSELAEFSYQPTTEIGTQLTEVVENAYSAQARMESYFLDTWNWNLTGSYSYSVEERNHKRGIIDENGLRGLFANGYDPANVSQNAGAFDSINVVGIEAYQASQTSARFVTSGELFEFHDLYGAGGPVSIAMGTEGQWEMTGDSHDQNLVQTQTNYLLFPNQQGSRTVNSAFTELVAYPLENLELQIAGRFDNYSDFGSVTNPKVSLGFRPSKNVLLRSSWGTNFNAPSVRNMIQRDQYGAEKFTVNQAGDQRYIPTYRYRDPNLKPEQGENYNFGMVIQPNKRWTFSIDQWNFHGTGIIGKLYGSDYSSLLQSVSSEELAKMGATFEKDANGDIISARVPAVFNRGERYIRGLDISVGFSSQIKLFGKVLNSSANMDHTHMLVYKTRNTVGSDYRFLQDLQWKNTMSYSISTKVNSFRVAARSLPGITENTVGKQIRTHTEYDFNYSYKLPFWTASLTLGAKNILNSLPPTFQGGNYVDYNGTSNSYAFQSLGRRYYVGYSQSF